MKSYLITILTFLSFTLVAQTSYSGFIDKYPIQLVTFIYSDEDVRAVYAYDKHDTPIVINGRLANNTLELFEKNEKGAIQARLVFDNFVDASSNNVLGVWTNNDSTKRFNISLTKQFQIDRSTKTGWEKREILQTISLDKHYFKLLLSNEASDSDERVTGVKIIEKGTDKLIQQIDLDCQLIGLDNISIGDYNFDGQQDFSVFESSYAGANTSRIYILKLPTSDKYFVSDFSGTSLQFDSDSKLITERNQCCAGRSVTTATYKVVDNKMILVKTECFEYDVEKEEFIKRQCD